MKTLFVFPAVVIFTLLSSVVQHANALEIGDDAPEIAIEKWINRGPIKIKERDGEKIYVVEFWATWCPPCRESIPHLSKLQTKYKENGVEIIGITNESIEVVEEFAGKAGFTYNVGVDKSSFIGNDKLKLNQTNTLYRNGENGIPHAYVIGKDGKIAWYGHPMEEMEMDTVIEQIIEDKFDRKKAAKICLLRKKMNEAKYARDIKNLIKIANKILGVIPNDKRAFGTLSQLYLYEEDPKSYKKLCGTLVDAGSKNSKMLSFASEAMLTNNDLRFRDINIALKAAKSANQIGDNPQTLELLGRIYFELGHIDKAIMYLEKALSKADDEYDKEKLEDMLNYYTSVLQLSKSLSQ